MSKGFLVIAQNNPNVDYVTQAYALALSIQSSQSTVKSISLVTNNIVPEEYKSAFDQILPILFNDSAAKSAWKVENRWKLYHASPYDETIVLDTDMLMLGDISLWWEHCNNYDIKFCSKVKNYKQEIIKIDPFHRKTFIANRLSNPYFALHYFKKTATAKDFYTALEFVSKNWEWSYKKFAPNEYQNWLSLDLASAIAIEITGFYNCVSDANCPLEFVHMKPALQGLHDFQNSNWTNNINHTLNSKGELLVENIKQPKLFHYVEKQFITPKIISKLQGLI